MTDSSRCPKSTAKQSSKKADEESAVVATLAAMSEPDRTLGERLHAIVKASAPATYHGSTG